MQLKSKEPFRNKLVFMWTLIICSHTVLNLKKDQNSHLLLALGISDHELVKFYIVEICHFIMFYDG